MTAKLAYMYGQLDDLPPVYPWDMSPQRIRSIKGNDNGTLIITTDDVVYRVPYDRAMKMPMRPDGSTKDWEERPRTDEVCIGDTIAKRYVVTDFYRIPNASLMTVGIEYLDKTTGKRVHFVSFAGQPVMTSGTAIRRSPRGESIDSRSDHPERGPYADRMIDGVVYWFLVHPTGRGRWSDDVPKFERKSDPGEYRSRPIPSYGKGWVKLWNSVEFMGLNATMRHPNDPEYQG